MSLDQPTKDLLTQEAVTLIEDAAYLGTFNNFSAFRERNKYRNLFLGLTDFKLVYTNIDRKSQAIITYEASTSAAEGEFSTPGLGQPFQGDQFDNFATYSYSIHHHRNLSTDINIKLHLGSYKLTSFRQYLYHQYFQFDFLGKLIIFFYTFFTRIEGVWWSLEQL